jgi:glycosyltransferase involved in cell wall biosynthesis
MCGHFDMKFKEILINLSMVGQRARGITRYAQEIINRCEELSEFQRFPVSYIFGKGNYPSWNNIGSRRCYYTNNIFSLDKGKLSGLCRYFLPPTLVSRDQIIFNPFYQGCIYLINQIITIYDLIPLQHPNQNIFQHLAFKYLLPCLLKNSLHILAISQTTKESVQKIYGIEGSKITAIRCGVNREIFYPDDSPVKSNSLLVVGAHLPHKNIHELLKYHQLWSSKYTLEIIAADSPYLIKLKGLVERLRIRDRVKFSSGLDDFTLAERYRRTQALIFPSLEEGFGIPPIEAMSCGTPVVASDIPVHREVCGDAAIYISPGNQESWEKAFDILRQDDLLCDHIDRGLEQAKQFSWVNSAVQLTDLFKTMMQ